MHNENSEGDIGSAGSLHRLLRGLAVQRSQRRDEFITAELTNHLFQSGSFPFGLDLAAINIQRGRDHGIPSYTQWREPCGLSPIRDWFDLEKVVGFDSAKRIQAGYRSVDDVDLFVAGLAERPVVGGLVGPTFACIIAQQFSNLRKGDRFWYENDGFESSMTPAQLQSLRQVSLAQIICRTLGGGTLQPNVFLPHDQLGNARQPCGTGSLAPIDLRPWQERDPSLGKKDDINPFLNPFLTKQESIDLVSSAENVDSRPVRVPPVVLRPPDIRPNREPEPSIIISQAGVRPSKTPVIPAHLLADVVRPNREPTSSHRPQTGIASIQLIPDDVQIPDPTKLVPAEEAVSSTDQPSLSPNPFASIHPNHVQTLASSSNGVNHVVVDKTDFSSTATISTQDLPQTSSSSSRPTKVDNKIEFTAQPTRRPTPNRNGQLVTKKKTTSTVTVANTKTKHIDSSTDEQRTSELKKKTGLDNRRKRETIDKDHSPDKVDATTNRLTNIVQTLHGNDNIEARQILLNIDRNPSYDLEIKVKPPTPTLLVRPLLTRPKPNLVVLLDDQQTHADLQDFKHSTVKQFSYNRPPTTPKPYRPNKYEYPPSNGQQYALSYDVTVTTTETFSYYRPLGQTPTNFDNNEPFDQSPDQPYSHFVPDKRDPISSGMATYASTPFSYDPKNQKLNQGGSDGRLTRPFHKQLSPATNGQQRQRRPPTKLDFDDETTSTGHLSPFSNASGLSTNSNHRPHTIYVDQYNEDIQRPTTNKPPNRYQDLDNRPGEVIYIAPEVTTPAPSLFNYTNLYPSVVLQRFVTSISKYFGYSRNGLTRLRRNETIDDANLKDLTKAIQGLYNNTELQNLTDFEDSDKLIKTLTDLTNKQDGPITNDIPQLLTTTNVKLTGLQTTNTNTPLKTLPDYLEHLTNGTIQFDLDGYLRPEHMHFDRLTTPNRSNTAVDPASNPYDHHIKHTNDPDHPNDPCEHSALLPQPIAPLNNIKPKAPQENRIYHPEFIQSRARQQGAISLVPLQVLTRPER